MGDGFHLGKPRLGNEISKSLRGVTAKTLICNPDFKPVLLDEVNVALKLGYLLQTSWLDWSKSQLISCHPYRQGAPTNSN